MRSTVVLAMHGAPPRDFPRRELGEFFGLHARRSHATGEERAAVERRHAEMEAMMRAWPRTADNDPFHAAARQMASLLEDRAGWPVVVGFNEFCAPTLDEAIDYAVEKGAERVVVITPMMTRGGGHAETEIPETVKRARERHPGVSMDYAWPFEPTEVAGFLAAQLRRFAPSE